MFSLCFYPTLLSLFSGQQTKTKTEGKDDPHLQRIETKFQRDPLSGCGEKGILPHL